MFLVNNIIALLAANLILNQALGTSTLFIAANNRRNLIWTAVAITMFTTIGGTAAYFAAAYLPDSLKDVTLLIYTLIICILYAALLSVLFFFSREIFNRTKKYVHISAFNCAVMGTLFTITNLANDNSAFMHIGTFTASGLEAGIGFVIASFILTAAYRKLNSAKVPASFRGFPAMLVYLGIISMAVYALK